MNPVISLISIVLLGFSLAAIFPTLTSDTPQRVGVRHAPNAIGYQMSAASIGIAVLPGLAGVLADATGLEVIVPFLLINSIALLLVYELILRLLKVSEANR
jgi:fucose permease